MGLVDKLNKVAATGWHYYWCCRPGQGFRFLLLPSKSVERDDSLFYLRKHPAR